MLIKDVEIKLPLVPSAGYSIFANKIIPIPNEKQGTSSCVTIQISACRKDAGDCLLEFERLYRDTYDFAKKLQEANHD